MKFIQNFFNPVVSYLIRSELPRPSTTSKRGRRRQYLIDLNARLLNLCILVPPKGCTSHTRLRNDRFAPGSDCALSAKKHLRSTTAYSTTSYIPVSKTTNNQKRFGYFRNTLQFQQVLRDILIQLFLLFTFNEHLQKTEWIGEQK